MTHIVLTLHTSALQLERKTKDPMVGNNAAVSRIVSLSKEVQNFWAQLPRGSVASAEEVFAVLEVIAGACASLGLAYNDGRRHDAGGERLGEILHEARGHDSLNAPVYERLMAMSDAYVEEFVADESALEDARNSLRSWDLVRNSEDNEDVVVDPTLKGLLEIELEKDQYYSGVSTKHRSARLSREKVISQAGDALRRVLQAESCLQVVKDDLREKLTERLLRVLWTW